MKKVLIPGELLIESSHDATDWHYEVGGAAVVVAAARAHHGIEPYVLATVGKDVAGQWLEQEMAAANLPIIGVSTVEVPTTVMNFASKALRRGAGAHLKMSMVNEMLLGDYEALVLASSLALLGGDLWATYTALFAHALAAQKLVVVSAAHDEAWFGLTTTQYVNRLMQLAARASVLKVTTSELKLVTGTSDPARGVHFFHELGTEVVIVTAPDHGVYVSAPAGQIHVPTKPWGGKFLTHAEDVFLGDLVGSLLNSNEQLINLRKTDWIHMIQRASIVAGLKTLKRGGLSGQASKVEIEVALHKAEKR